MTLGDIEIFSMMAALCGGRDVTWKGRVGTIQLGVEHSELDAMNAEQVNAMLWRFFNRVDDGDEAKLETVGYRLPSLSVGDFITWGVDTERHTYQVAASGFKKITHSREAVMDFFVAGLDR